MDDLTKITPYKFRAKQRAAREALAHYRARRRAALEAIRAARARFDRGSGPLQIRRENEIGEAVEARFWWRRAVEAVEFWRGRVETGAAWSPAALARHHARTR